MLPSKPPTNGTIHWKTQYDTVVDEQQLSYQGRTHPPTHLGLRNEPELAGYGEYPTRGVISSRLVSVTSQNSPVTGHSQL